MTDASSVTASGDGLGLVPCGKPTSFVVQAPGGRIQDIAVKIVGKWTVVQGSCNFVS